MATTPEKKLSQPPTLARKEAPVAPSSRRETKPPYVPTLSERFRIASIRTILAAAAIGAGLGAQHHVEYSEPLSPEGIAQDIGAIPLTAQQDIDRLARYFGWNIHLEPKTPPLDNGQIKPQHIKAGPEGNAEAATKEQIQTFVNKTTPLLEKPTNEKAAPIVNILLPLNPENTRDVVVSKDALTQGLRHNIYKKIQIIGTDVPFYIPIVEGAEKVAVKTAFNASGIRDIYLRYHLKNGQEIDMDVALGDNNFIPTNTMTNIPTYNPSVLKTQTERDTVPTKEFDLSQNPRVDLFHVLGSSLVSISGSWSGNIGVDISIATDGGKVQYISSVK